MTTAIVDADYILHAVSCVGEKRSVRVVHKVSGREISVPNKTTFYGDWRKKEGGLLAEINKAKNSSFVWDDFEYIDVQEAEPIDHVLHSAKTMLNSVVKAVGATKHKAFIGSGKTFRNDVATVLEYKGNRKELITPLLIEDVRDYMVNRLKVEVVESIEADDRCIIEAYKKKDHIVIAVDKDTGGNAVNWYNPNHPDNGIVNCDTFGKLWIDDKGEVKGIGRLFFYFQVCYGDDVDNYRANSATTMKWGKKSAYKALVDCKTDKEALQVVVDCYKKLYPEPKVIQGWRGDEFEVDWLYIANENWQLARMLRTMDELNKPVLLADALDKMGLR